MKRSIFMLFIDILVILLFSLACALADGMEKQQAIYVLPLSLQEIEEDAFSDTAAEIIVCPDGLAYIAKNAFSGMKRLMDVFIPESTKYIDESAFSITPNFVIHGVKGSYAEDWAEKHGILFVVENIWKLALDNRKTVSIPRSGMDFFYRIVNPERIIRMVQRTEGEDESKRPQDRPELNPIDYRFP